MNKKLIALAIAAAFAAPAAMADTGNVKISGKIDMSVDSLNGENAAKTDNTRETNLSNNSSYIRFSGDEDLGNGLKAVWQVSNFVDMGSGAGNGWASDDSFVGMSGNFGAVKLGKMATPMKVISRKIDLFGNHIGDSRNLVSKDSSATGSGAWGWDLRTNNTIAYQTPDFSGFGATVAYVTNKDTGAATDKTLSAWSANGIYNNGPVFVGLAYEKHNLSDAGTGLQDEHAWRLGAGYSFGEAKVVALYQKADDLGGTSGADRKVWGLGGAYKMGMNTLKAQYYKAGDFHDQSNTGADMWALGVDHAMSKRTTLYAAYARTSNDSGANYSAFGAGHGDNPGTATGKDPDGLSLGIIHKF